MSAESEYKALAEKARSAKTPEDADAAKAAKLAWTKEFQRRNSNKNDRLGHKAFKSVVRNVHSSMG